MGRTAGAADMKWTSEKPTRKGWYWWRQDKEAVICRVWEWWDKQELYVRFEGSDSAPVNTLDGEWAGPLDPPT